jgi:hypothetical protein
MESKPSPVVFWHSDPVGPNETVMLSGHLLGKGASVELLRLDDDKAGKVAREFTGDWRGAVGPEVLAQDEQALSFVIPADWQMGIYAGRVRRGGAASEPFLVNAPDCWWFQGDKGLRATTAGSWLRVLGKALSLDGEASAMLCSGTKSQVLKAVKASLYSLEFAIPAGAAAGEHELFIHNGCGGAAGWRRAGVVTLHAQATARETTLNVVDFGADPEGLKDSTLAIVQATERLSSYGGGVVYFPSGRYRIDSILRTGTFINSPIVLPRGISFKGESRDLVSLWWPDHQEPMYTLIECMGQNTISDLSIYTQGRHRTTISADTDDITIHHVLIRANCHYMCCQGGRSHHRRGVEEPWFKMGNALEFNRSRNVQITDCDIYNSTGIFRLKHVEGCRIADCVVHGSGLGEIAGGDGKIIENIDFNANSLTSWGSSCTLHYGAVRNQHLYFAGNKIARIFGGDHEALTFDGHGTAYVGAVAKVDGASVTLARDPMTGMDGVRDNLPSLERTTLFILGGRGRGQYRHIAAFAGRTMQLESPFAVEPDASSVVSIGGFNGRHLIIGNTMEDTGTIVQLYPPNYETIVAGNKAIRASNMNSCSKIGRNTGNRFQRVEPSWYNQFLDNRVLVGNAWGGGEAEIDRWLGGEGTLNIWGWQVRYHVDPHGCDQDALLEEKDLEEMLGMRNPTPGRTLPSSIFQVVRRHLVDNNSSIRIRGAVADALIEGCRIAASKRGIRIDSEVVKPHCEDIGQLVFEPPQPEVPANAPQPFLSPVRIIVRNNTFDRVVTPYGGTARRWAKIIE